MQPTSAPDDGQRAFTHELAFLAEASALLAELPHDEPALQRITSLAVIAVDMAGQVTLANRAAATLTGWGAAEAQGRALEEVVRLVDGATGEPVGLADQALRREEGGLARHALLLTPDGRAVPVDVGGARRRDEQGRPAGAVLLLREVSERRGDEGQRAQDARLLEEAKAAIAARDQFLSIAAHELRTPLTAMLGYARLLERRQSRAPTLDERDQRALRTIVAQGLRLDDLVNLLLDLSRIEAGRLQLDSAELDLTALVRQQADDLLPTLERHTLALDLPGEPLVVMGDAVRLDQVLQNLLHNAVKYSPDGGRIGVRLERQTGFAALTVSDEGIGVPADALPQLFQRFFRAPNAAALHISGSGVGLYVVREIVARHSGTVAVTSVEGAGAAFTVRIPLVPPPPRRETQSRPLSATEGTTERH